MAMLANAVLCRIVGRVRAKLININIDSLSLALHLTRTAELASI